MPTLKLTLSLLLLCAATPSWAQERCLAPTPVRSLDQIKEHPLALRSRWGPSFVGEKCTRLRRGDFGSSLQFYVVPPASGDSSTAYVLIKSYRTFTIATGDKIKLSRGDGWQTEKSTNSSVDKLSGMRDEPFRGTVEKWNALHAAATSPEAMRSQIGKPWHAYADADKGLPSTDLTSFWQTGDFDFTKGSQTNYLIRFPSNTQTPIPFEVGRQPELSEIRLEFYSNIDALSGRSFRFVFDK